MWFMTEQEQLEQQIQEVLAAEAQAIPLSNKLFGPEGLFSKLGRTEEERRKVAQTPLFQQAQRRLTQLQQAEAAAFARAVQQTQAGRPESGYLAKLERADSI
jgi:hypothetical protein